MSFILVVVYAAIAIYVIWWALSGAKKLDAGHGDHSHDNQPVEAPPRPAAAQDADDLTRINTGKLFVKGV